MNERKYQLCGLGNALIDILVEVGEEEFAKLGWEKGTQRLVTAEEQRELIHQTVSHQPVLASGGSVANSVVTFAQLGGRAAFVGLVADDQHGEFFKQELDELGVYFPVQPKVGGVSGSCLSVITPDAERTMRTCLAASGEFGPEHLSPSLIDDSEWLFVEGYSLANPEFGLNAVRRGIKLAQAAGTKIAITISEAWIVAAFRKEVEEVLEVAELVVANETEAKAIADAADAKEAFSKLAERIPQLVVTVGEQGVLVKAPDGERHHVPAFSCVPKDLTGAGDTFVGGYLYGLTHGVPAEQAAKGGCFLASKVISQFGARLHRGVKEFWAEGIKIG